MTRALPLDTRALRLIVGAMATCALGFAGSAVWSCGNWPAVAALLRGLS